MTPDPAALARRLSPAQAKALMWLPEDGTGSAEPPPFVWTYHALQQLWDHLNLADVTSDWRWHLTPLGLAVRAELVRREAGNGGA